MTPQSVMRCGFVHTHLPRFRRFLLLLIIIVVRRVKIQPGSSLLRPQDGHDSADKIHRSGPEESSSEKRIPARIPRKRHQIRAGIV